MFPSEQHWGVADALQQLLMGQHTPPQQVWFCVAGLTPQHVVFPHTPQQIAVDLSAPQQVAAGRQQGREYAPPPVTVRHTGQLAGEGEGEGDGVGDTSSGDDRDGQGDGDGALDSALPI